MGMQADSLRTTELFELSFEELMKVKVRGVSQKPEPITETPMSVYIANNEELNRWGARSLYEVLGRIPGYNFYHTDFYGQFGVIGRGMSSIWRYSMGFEFLELDDFGHYTFTPHFFKNVEVARGPAGLTWGGSAEAGLINFNIRDDLDGSEIITEIGNYNRFSADILVGDKFDKEGDGFFIGFHHEQQGYQETPNELGIFDPDTLPYLKMNGLNPSWSVLAKYKKDALKVIFFKDHNDHVTPHYWDWNEPEQIAYIDTLAKKNGAFHDELETTALRAEYNLLENNKKADLSIFGEYYQRHWFVVGLASLNQRRGTIGFNYKQSFLDNHMSLILGGDLYSVVHSHDPNTNSYKATQYGFNWYANNYYPKSDEYCNLYAQVDYRLNPKFFFLLGGRLDYQEGAKNELLFSGPRIGVVYNPLKNLTFKALYNKTDRRPLGNEISENSDSHASTENLEVYEIVAMYDIANLFHLSVTLFQQQLNDRIFKLIAGDHSGFGNGGGITTKGVEIDLKYYPTRKLLAYLNCHYHNSEAISTTFDSVSYSVDRLSDGSLPFSPKIMNFIGAEYAIQDIAFINLALRSNIGIPYKDTDQREKELSVHFFDLTVRTKSFARDHISFYANCLNLFNNQNHVPAFGEHFQNSNGTIIPEGRRISLGVKLTF